MLWGRLYILIGIITRELRFYYRDWADLFVERKWLIWAHFMYRTCIKDRYYEKQAKYHHLRARTYAQVKMLSHIIKFFYLSHRQICG